MCMGMDGCMCACMGMDGCVCVWEWMAVCVCVHGNGWLYVCVCMGMDGCVRVWEWMAVCVDVHIAGNFCGVKFSCIFKNFLIYGQKFVIHSRNIL